MVDEISEHYEAIDMQQNYDIEPEVEQEIVEQSEDNFVEPNVEKSES